MSYLDILNKIEQQPKRHENSHTLVIDGNNMFIRSFTILQFANSQGHHIGGLVGFLRSLGYLITQMNPTRVIVVFDGPDSSQRRKRIDSNYKANRGHGRMTQWEIFESKDQEFESMSAQMARLRDYLQVLPVDTIIMPKVEADDVIAQIAHQLGKDQQKVTIVSSDKDFLQLVSPNVEVYSPIKKKYITTENVRLEVGGFTAKNYLIAKALTGDKSDNLAGVKGLGDKTLAKIFPALLEHKRQDLDYIFDVCEKGLDTGKKVYTNVLARWEDINTNYELMNLLEPHISEQQQQVIDEVIQEPSKAFIPYVFLDLLKDDLIHGGIVRNTSEWLERFRYISKIEE